jgi:antitoxin component YwqK of YwqJK toxin-antitoxin module
VTSLALALLLVSVPLQCPPGTERRGAPPPDGIEEWCESRDPAGQPQREGPARTWYDDGTPWVEESYAAGLRQGRFVERHRNGRIACEGAYAKGSKEGRWTIWFESGGKEEEASFRAGILDGPFAAWHRSGAKRAEGRHCGGAQCGVWKTWDADGHLLGTIEYGELRVSP